MPAHGGTDATMPRLYSLDAVAKRDGVIVLGHHLANGKSVHLDVVESQFDAIRGMVAAGDIAIYGALASLLAPPVVVPAPVEPAPVAKSK